MNRKVVHSIVFSCSENEARNYGVFLADIMKYMNAWHKDMKLYLQDCITNECPGFVKTAS